MKNIISFVRSARYLFSQRPLGEVDSLVFSQLSYLNLEGFAGDPSQPEAAPCLGQIADEKNRAALCRGTVGERNNMRLLDAVSQSRRFRSVRLFCFEERLDEDREEQFAAVTFLPDDGTAYIAFRGTDASIVGWKEDFNMGYTCPVPAQEAGLAYLNRAGRLFSGKLIAGGHSKGGNIAVYAAMLCEEEIRGRLSAVYSHDGPGFRDEILKKAEYNEISAKIRKTLPESSVVGMMLQHQELYEVVKCRGIGLFQHDPYTWRVSGPHFIYADALSRNSLLVNQALSDWINSMEDCDRRRFIDTVFDIISAAQAKTVYEFASQSGKKAGALRRAVKALDGETRGFVSEVLRSLAAVGMKHYKASVREKYLNMRAVSRLFSRKSAPLGLEDGEGDKDSTTTV